MHQAIEGGQTMCHHVMQLCKGNLSRKISIIHNYWCTLPGKIIHLGYYLHAFTHEELEVARLSPSNTVREAHSLILRVSDFEVSCLRNTYLLLLFKYMNTRFFFRTRKQPLKTLVTL